MDIARILRKLPKGTMLYSPAFGNIELTDVNADGLITVWSTSIGKHLKFFKDGCLSNMGECMIFPSKDNRVWESFQVPKFDANTLKPFDRVLTRRENATTWFANSFSHLALRYDKFACVNQHYYSQCVPFDEDTEHLLGKSDDAPEFYKTWE